MENPNATLRALLELERASRYHLQICDDASATDAELARADAELRSALQEAKVIRRREEPEA
jgi:hypothetical protein